MKVESLRIYVDHTLDVLGYIPVVSQFSGPVRVGLGSAQVVAALAIIVIMTLAEQWHQLHATAAGSTSHVLSERLVKSTHALSYGTIQIARGLVETIGLVGNLIALLADFSVDALKQRTIYAWVWNESDMDLDRPIFNAKLIKDGLELLSGTTHWIDVQLSSFMKGMKSSLLPLSAGSGLEYVSAVESLPLAQTNSNHNGV